jgi:hypothetical protein
MEFLKLAYQTRIARAIGRDIAYQFDAGRKEQGVRAPETRPSSLSDLGFGRNILSRIWHTAHEHCR